MKHASTDPSQRERSRSPRRRSRSPRRSRRSYSPRSRSRSRDDYRRTDRRSRSPMSGAAGASGGYSGSNYGGRGGGAPPSARSFEERAQAKEQMMQSVRDSSQQDRRVYVGNLSYDVKWHHLKDFMRQGQCKAVLRTLDSANHNHCSWRRSLRRRIVTSEWNVEGGRQYVDVAGLFLGYCWTLD